MKTVFNITSASFIGISLLISSACTPKKEHTPSEQSLPDPVSMQAEYNIANHYSAAEADTLLLNIVTYIGKKPPQADQVTRFDPEFRNHFAGQTAGYKYIFYHLSPDSMHYVYLKRPARSVHGDQRGVAISFRISEDLNVTSFKEIFNTPITDSAGVYHTGAILFRELVEQGQVTRYIGHDTLIEWPDHRMEYDTLKYEWRYVRDL